MIEHKTPHAPCKACGKPVQVKVNGGVSVHPSGVRYTPSYRNRCQGSGYPPKDEE
jgi:hypothetical protein